MIYVDFFVFFWGIFTFFKSQKYITLLVIFLLSTNYLGFDSSNVYLGSISLQHGDFALLTIIILFPFRKKILDKRLNPISKSIIIFFIFLSISILIDLLVRDSTILQIFRTTRKVAYLIFFYLINSFNKEDYRKFISYIFTITIIHTLLYISQYITGTYIGTNTLGLEMVNENYEARYSNLAPFILPILAYNLQIPQKNTTLWTFILITSIVLSQTRGLIISAFIILIVSTLLKKDEKIRNLILHSSFALLGYFILLYAMPIINDRFADVNEQYSSIFEMNFDDLNSFYHHGSFIFRVGMTYERFMYVLNDFSSVIFGVGYIPDMDITSPIFILGTASPTLLTGYEQYNSVDIFFPNIITRYGFLGSAIYLNLIVQIFNLCFKNIKLLWSKVLLAYMLSLIGICFINECFYNGQMFLFIFIFIHALSIENKKTIIKNTATRNTP